MQHCDSTCRWCFSDWVKWWKARENRMKLPHKKSGSSTVSFAEAASTSVKPNP